MWRAVGMNAVFGNGGTTIIMIGKDVDVFIEEVEQQLLLCWL